jgi:hypothetical protein
VFGTGFIHGFRCAWLHELSYEFKLCMASWGLVLQLSMAAGSFLRSSVVHGFMGFSTSVVHGFMRFATGFSCDRFIVVQSSVVHGIMGFSTGFSCA